VFKSRQILEDSVLTSEYWDPAA